jgi:Flp pilus assembly protein TadD/4-amino-4-deoxy-L-arabinose transferase-like glycosyltransferase
LPRSRFLLFLAGVFALKLIVVFQLHDHPLLQPDAGIDTSAYVALAQRVRSGDLALGPGLYYVSPLYIYWLAVTFAAFQSFTAVRVLQAALGTVAVGCVFVAARQWFGNRAAWIAATAAALTGLFTFYESLLLQTALDPFLTAASLAALALALTLRKDTSRWFVATGVLFGLQTLNRPNVVVAAAAVGVALLVLRRWRAVALLVVGGAIALTPAVLRNAKVAGEWSPLSSHGGLNFYIGNNADADGTYHSVPGVTPNIEGQERDTRRIAEQALGHQLTDAQVSTYFVDLGLKWIREDPVAAASLAGRKLAYTLSAVHLPLNDSYTFYAYDEGTLLLVLAGGAWILIPLGLAGLIIYAPRDRLRPYLVWTSFVPAYAVSVAVFFAADRYRLPLLVPMCVGTGAWIDGVWSRWLQEARPKPSRYMLSVALALVFFILVNWPLHLDDGRSEERTRMAEQSAAMGSRAEAEQWAAKAEAMSGEPSVVQFRVGRAFSQSHDPAAAVTYLQRAVTLAPGRPEIEYALGQALMDSGRPEEAIPHLRIAVEQGVRTDLAGVDLVRALVAVGDRDAAIRILSSIAPANAADADSWLVLGELAVQLAAQDLQVRFFDRAVDANPSNATAHLNLAVALAQSGRLHEARTHAAEALRLQPDYEKAIRLLTALGEKGR